MVNVQMCECANVQMVALDCANLSVCVNMVSA